MEIKIKNNITRILTDINRSVSEMEHVKTISSEPYIDLLLSQTNYLADNLKILKRLTNSQREANESIENHTNIKAKPTNTLLAQNTKTNSDLVLNIKDNSFINNMQQNLPTRPTVDIRHNSYEAETSNKQALRNIISLNDKFTFVRYLFKNNITIYSEHINNIDKLTNKEDVLIYINKYLSKLYDWDNHPDKKELFINIIEKQFE